VGFAGDIFRTGSGEAVANVFEDAKHRFTDLWCPQRTQDQYEYRSLVKTPIRAAGESRPLGVLGFYSWDYCFNKQDLALINELADLIGELIAGGGIDYRVDYEPPGERRPFPFGST
jgi:hypothetical protein